MIVVDTNLIAYCWLKGPQTEAAQAVRAKDPDWHVPILWRSEFRSVLSGYMRHGTFSLREAQHIMSTAETELADAEHEIDSRLVLELAQQSKLSAYDCEYVVLARVLGAALITADKAVLRAAPGVAMNMQEYLQAGTTSNGAKKKRAPLVPVYAVKGKGKSGLVAGLNPLSNKAMLEAVDSGASA